MLSTLKILQNAREEVLASNTWTRQEQDAYRILCAAIGHHIGAARKSSVDWLSCMYE